MKLGFELTKENREKETFVQRKKKNQRRKPLIERKFIKLMKLF